MIGDACGIWPCCYQLVHGLSVMQWNTCSPVTKSSCTDYLRYFWSLALLLSAAAQIIGATFRVGPLGLSVGAQIIGDTSGVWPCCCQLVHRFLVIQWNATLLLRVNARIICATFGVWPYCCRLLLKLSVLPSEYVPGCTNVGCCSNYRCYLQSMSPGAQMIGDTCGVWPCCYQFVHRLSVIQWNTALLLRVTNYLCYFWSLALLLSAGAQIIHATFTVCPSDYQLVHRLSVIPLEHGPVANSKCMDYR